PPGVAAPVRARAADAFARQERAEPPHRQRLLRRIVADGERVARSVLHQLVADHVAQLVADVGNRKVLVRTGQSAAFERDHLQAGLGQLLGENAAGPAKPDDDDIDFLQPRCHLILPQLISAMPRMSAVYFLSRYFSTFSRCTAITPGKPISFQPALLRLPP